LSQACSSAETLATLYLRALNLGQSVASSSIPGPFRGSPGPTIETITGECYNGDFTDPSLDRLIFSPVHYAWYVLCAVQSLLIDLRNMGENAHQSPFFYFPFFSYDLPFSPVFFMPSLWKLAAWINRHSTATTKMGVR
jgi:hypothetical protein